MHSNDPQLWGNAYSSADQFSQIIGEAVAGVRTGPREGRPVRGTVRGVRAPRVTLFRVNGTPFTVAGEPRSAICSVTFAFDCAFRSRVGGRWAEYGCERAQLRSPLSPFELRWTGATNALVVHVHADAIDPIDRCRLGLTDSGSATDVSLDLSRGPAAALLRYAEYLWREYRLTDGLGSSALALAESESTLFALLGDCLAKTRDDRRATFVERSLMRAREHVEAHLETPLSRDALARASGVSPRTLSRLFAARLGVGPMTYVRQRRLEAARRALIAATPDDSSVTETALRFGFSGLGRFSTDYQRTFGECPSETLRRS